MTTTLPDPTAADPTTADSTTADSTPHRPSPTCPVPRVRCLRGGTTRRPRLPPPPPPVDLTPCDDGEARRAIAATMRTALEVLDGRRPAAQIGSLFDARALRYWRAERARAERVIPSRLVRLRLGLPRPDAAEVAAVCTIDGRVRALAARFERREQGWCCASVRLI